MTSPAPYQCLRDLDSGLWQITSPSGHVLFESSRRRTAARICRELNGHFRGANCGETMAAAAALA